MKTLRTLLAAIGNFLFARLTAYMGRSGLIAYLENPTAQDFETYRVTNRNQSEIVRQTLYDYQLYPAAGAAQLNFFSQPAGQGIGTAIGAAVGATKTLSDTNLVLPNQLPSGLAILVESIEVFFFAGSSAAANTYTPANLSLFATVAIATLAAQLNDVNTIYQSGLLELNILQKNYLRETPLSRFPPKTGFEVNSAVSTNSATVGEAAIAQGKAVGRAMYLEPPIAIHPAVNFEVKVSWPAAVPTPSTFNGRIGVVLDGFQMRASQ